MTTEEALEKLFKKERDTTRRKVLALYEAMKKALGEQDMTTREALEGLFRVGLLTVQEFEAAEKRDMTAVEVLEELFKKERDTTQREVVVLYEAILETLDESFKAGLLTEREFKVAQRAGVQAAKRLARGR